MNSIEGSDCIRPIAAGRAPEKRPLAKFAVRLRAGGNLSSPVGKGQHPRTINSRVRKVVGSVLPGNSVSSFTRPAVRLMSQRLTVT